MAAKYYYYRNLHKPGYFSVKLRGKIVSHQQVIKLTNAQFIVSGKGSAKVKSTGVRNVHAYVAVDDYQPCNEEDITLDGMERISYYPHSNDSFVWVDTNEPVSHVFSGYLVNGQVFARKAGSLGEIKINERM